MSCLGNPVLETPSLDALHARSVRFTNFHVSPTCAPSRSALMTGRYCNRTGVWHTIMGRSLLHSDEVTIADVFSAAGYKTGIFGKWHLGDNYPFRPQDRGFQEVLVHGGGGVGQTPDYWGNDYFDDTYRHNGVPTEFSGYCTDIWFDHALRFIEDNRDTPFFCYITTNAPHSPYRVPERYSKPLEGKGVPVQQAAFYGMVANIDENVGRLTRRLASLELDQNIIVIFMTDNGTSAGHHAGMRGKKGSEYDGGHRVPCFVSWPRAPWDNGRDISRITSHIDLFPTLIDICGMEPPDALPVDGASLVPLLHGNDAQWHDRVIVTDSQRIEHPEKWRKSAVMTDRWRLINGKELYDMTEDPGQKNDVSHEHPEVVKRLRGEYDKWWESVSRRFDDYVDIVIGHDEQNPTTLKCHDWHGPKVPWNQNHIRDAMQANGFWAVRVAQSGTYQFALRRWPNEVQAPITAAIENSTAIEARDARIKIGDFDQTKPIPDNAHEVTFTTRLEPGTTKLQTWFTSESGRSRGAYYVRVERLD